jgi:putative MATE family efflux protein
MSSAAPLRLRGGRDLTVGPIGPTMLAFALPTLGQSVLQSLNGLINAMWVGRLVGETGLTATVNANNVLFLLLAAVIGIAMASTILIGQAIGRRDLMGAKRVLGTSVSFFALAAAALGLVGWLAAPALLDALGTPQAAREPAIGYMRILFAGLPVIWMLSVLSMALRGAGDAATPLRFTLLATLLDAALVPLFVRGLGPVPGMGVPGAALATVISTAIAVAALVGFAYWRRFDLRLTRTDLPLLRPDPAILRAAVTKGVPMGLQMVVVSLSGLMMMALVNRHGVQTAAAYGVAMQLWGYVVMPALAVGAAASSMAAQNVGAGLWSRVEAVARSGVALNTALTMALIASIYLVQTPLMQLFLPGGDAAIAIARRINQVGLWGHVMLGVAFVLFAVVRATGAVNPPLVILTVALLVVRVPLAWWLEPRIGAEAVWASAPVSMAIAMVLAIAYYRHGRWREARMMREAPPGWAQRSGAVAADAPAVPPPAATGG